MTDAEQPPANGEGAAPRLKAVAERFAAAIDTVMDRVFDEPLDVSSAHEARQHLHAQPSSWLSSALAAQGVQWALARSAMTKAGAKMVARVGGVASRKVVLPVTVAVDVGLGAREGLRELQILASFLIHRLRAAGLPVDPDLVRRTTTAVYLEPRTFPEIGRSASSLSLGVARKWARHAVPGGKRRREADAEMRIIAVDRIDLDRLVAVWGRRRPAATGRVIEIPSLPPVTPALPPPPRLPPQS
jgi:hypothetical protein